MVLFTQRHQAVKEALMQSLFLVAVPFTASTFICICFPMLIPFGFVCTAYAPEAFELIRGDVLVKYGVFYLLWWFAGPLLLYLTSAIACARAIRDALSQPPTGLLVASMNVPFLITPFWWGSFWLICFPIAVLALGSFKWLAGDERLKQLHKSLWRWLGSEDVKATIMTLSEKVAKLRKWMLDQSSMSPKSKLLAKPALSTFHHRKSNSRYNFQTRPDLKKRTGKPQSMMQNVAVQALKYIPGLGWILFAYRAVTNSTSLGETFSQWKAKERVRSSSVYTTQARVTQQLQGNGEIRPRVHKRETGTSSASKTCEPTTNPQEWDLSSERKQRNTKDTCTNKPRPIDAPLVNGTNPGMKTELNEQVSAQQQLICERSNESNLLSSSVSSSRQETPRLMERRTSCDADTGAGERMVSNSIDIREESFFTPDVDRIFSGDQSGGEPSVGGTQESGYETAHSE